MPDIYTQFDKATSNITAYALIYAGKVAGRIVIKHGAACTAYVQIWGVEMTKGQARGGGYDRATAAVEQAVNKLPVTAPTLDPTACDALWAICHAFVDGDGSRWTSRLEANGFTLALVIG